MVEHKAPLRRRTRGLSDVSLGLLGSSNGLVGERPLRLHCIDNWILRFKRNGIEGLFDKPQAGNHRKLTIKQKEELKQLITTNTPEQFSFEGKFWNPVLVSRLIKQQYTISYHPEPSRRLLHAFGFTFHKPEKVNKRQKTGDKLRFEEKLKKDSETGVEEVIRWYW